MSDRRRRCMVPGCRVPIRPTEIMCWEHWGSVPEPLRNRVWDTWRGDPKSAEHVRAILDAVRAATAPER